MFTARRARTIKAMFLRRLDLTGARWGLDGAETIEGLVVDTELRWALVQRLAVVGRFDEAEIAGEYERDRTAAGERHAATARAARPTSEAKAEAWASVIESDKLPNALQEAVISGFVQTDQCELLAPYADRYFEVVKDIWGSRSHEMAQQIAIGLYPAIQVSRVLSKLAPSSTWPKTTRSSGRPSSRKIAIAGSASIARWVRIGTPTTTAVRAAAR